MRKKQNVVLSVAQGCIASLELDRRSWEQNSQISKKVLEVKADIETVLTLDAQTDALKPSVQTILLKNKLELVANKTNIVCFKVQIYARETGNEHLLKHVSFTERQLAKGSNENVLDRCSGVVSTVENNFNELQSQGISQDELVTIHALILECRHLLGKRVAIQSERTIKLKQKEECVTKISKSMDTLDKMVEVFISDHAVVERYKNSRSSKRFIGNRTAKKKETTELAEVAQA